MMTQKYLYSPAYRDTMDEYEFGIEMEKQRRMTLMTEATIRSTEALRENTRTHSARAEADLRAHLRMMKLYRSG